MIVTVRGSFKKDVSHIRHYDLVTSLEEKIKQIESAHDLTHVTGLKLLRGYTSHYRIIIRTEKYSFRIGAIIYGRTICLVRFLSRKKIYKEFP